jgi:hypothetical protein
VACTVDCAVPLCPAGVQTYVPADQCCPVCGIDCTQIACPQPLCPPGVPVVIPPGQCCGQCATVDAGAPTCNTSGLDSLLKNDFAKLDALACQSSTDCTIASLGGSCRLDCGTAVNTKAAPLIEEDVKSYSVANCLGCPQSNIACPPVFTSAVCQSGTCVKSP